jgi:hypothetical protein
LVSRILSEDKLTSNTLIGRINDTSNYVLSSSNILVSRILSEDKLTSNTLIGRINDTSNYITTASNILVPRILSEVASTSNTLIGRINDTSNYVLSSSNIISKRITDLNTDLINIGTNNRFIVNDEYNRNFTVNGNLIVTSNLTVYGNETRLETYVYTTEKLEVVNINNNLVALMVQQNNSSSNDIFIASNQSSKVFNITKNGDVNIIGSYKINNRDITQDTSNYIISASNILVPRIISEVTLASNILVPRILSEVTLASNILVPRILSEVTLASNILVPRILSEITLASNILVPRILSEITLACNILVPRILSEVTLASNILVPRILSEVTLACNILVPRILSEVRLASNILIPRILSEVASTSNTLIGRINDTSNYVRYTSNILMSFITTANLNSISDSNTSNYIASSSNILVSRILSEDKLTSNTLITALSGKQSTLTAGSGISIIGTTINSLWRNPAIFTTFASVNTSERVRIGSLTEAEALLQLTGNATNGGTLRLEYIGNTPNIEILRATGTASANYNWNILNDNSFKLQSKNLANSYASRFEISGDGNVGIGTSSSIPLHIYNATSSLLRLETSSTGKPSIQFAVGTLTDINTDYRIINDAYELKFQYQDNLVSYGGVGSDILSITDKRTNFIKDAYFQNNIGIKTFPDALYSLDVSGDIRVLSGNVGIGIEPATYKLNVLGDVNVSGVFRVGGIPISGGSLSQGMTVQTKHLTYTQMDIKNNTGWEPINDDLVNGFVIAITPASSSSKILVNMIAHIGTDPAYDARWWGIKLYRKIGAGAWTEVSGANGTETGAAAATQGTPVWVSHNLGSEGAIYGYFVANVTATYLDAPNTTSIVYYTAYWNSRIGDGTNPTGNIWLNRAYRQFDDAYRSAPSSSWTATEIWDLGTPYVPPSGDTTITIASSSVGVGATPNANYKLIVNQGTSGGTGATCFPLKISAGAYTNLGNGTATLIGLGTETSGWSKCAIGHSRTDTNDRGSIVFLCNNTADSTTTTMTDEKMRITSAGNVGIGTLTPQRSLHVQQALRIGGSGAVIDFGDDMTTQIYRSGTSQEIRFVTGNVDNRMIISSGGNVSIGTTDTATYKLNVNGTINATNILVNGGAISGSKWTTATDTTRIYYNTGNVGIGTINPVYKFHIKCSYSDVAQSLHLDANDNGNVNQYALTIYPYVIGSGEIGWRFRTQNQTGGTNTPLTLNNYGNVVVQGNLNMGSATINGDTFITSSRLVLRGTQPTLYLRDTDNRSGMIHMNSSIMYFLNANGNDSETWAQQNGQNWALQLNMNNNDANFGGTISAGGSLFASGNISVAGIIIHAVDKWHTSSDGRNRFYMANSGALYYSGGMSGGANARMHEWRRTYDDATLGFFENTGLFRSWNYSSLSDERIKKNIRDIDDLEALEKILLIQPKKYNYIEKEKNNHDVIGFIAQQIGEVIPEAITKTEGIPPNIYKNCLVYNKNEIYYSLPSNVEIGTDVIITDTEDGTGERYKIQEIHNDYFVIDKEIERDEVFVKGYSINDLHNLNKDYVFTLNVCATQELYRKIVSQEERIRELEEKVERLLNYIAL